MLRFLSQNGSNHGLANGPRVLERYQLFFDASVQLDSASLQYDG
jgi:hypothetical protein